MLGPSGRRGARAHPADSPARVRATRRAVPSRGSRRKVTRLVVRVSGKNEPAGAAFKFSGNFPDTFRTLLTRTSRPERTTRRPRASKRVPRARPCRPPSRRPPRVEPKSHPSRRRARFRKKRTRGSAFNFSGNFPETPDGVSRDCTDAPEHPRGSTKPPRRLIARFSRVFVPPFPYVVPFFFPSTRR